VRLHSTVRPLTIGVPVAAAVFALLPVQPLDSADGGASITDRTDARVAIPCKSQPDHGAWRSIHWRRSQPLGLPHAGRLVRGVRLPAEGVHYFTWDPIRRRSPNRAWRRWGTDDLVRTALRVVHAHATAHPGAPRVGIGDLSRPHGGDFGAGFGAIGHATHQNGLDVDVYYPLRSGAERAPLSVDEIDFALAQDLVDRFVHAGAVTVYVGPNTGLTGPPGVVESIPLHDNHLHARVPG
jgi:hypothetical protein